MDVNKNWVNWKYFDATTQFKFCGMNLNNTNPFSYTFENNGLYLFAAGAHGIVLSIQTDATRNDLYFNRGIGSGSSFQFTISLFNARTDQTLRATWSAAGSHPGVRALFYLGSGLTTGVEVGGIHDPNVYDVYREYRVSNVRNRVIIAINAGTSNSQVQCTTNVRDYATDGQRYACISTIGETGDAFVSVSGSQGQAPVISDIQLS